MPYTIGAVLLMIAPESPKFLNAVGRYEECLEVVKKIYSVNQRMPKDTFLVNTTQIYLLRDCDCSQLPSGL
jgi:hypothetical protein